MSDNIMQTLIDEQKARQTGTSYKPNPELQMLTPQTDNSYMQTLIDEQKARQSGSDNGKPVEGPQPLTVDGAIEKHIELKFSNYMQYIGDELGIGAQQAYEGDTGAEAASGDISFEEAEQRIADGKKRAEEAGARNESFKANLPNWQKFIQYSEPGLQALPTFMSNMSAYGKGFAAGGSLGAILGGGIPAAEAVTVPALGTWFATSALGVDMFRKAKGHRYLELRRKGLTHEQALASATGVGAIQGVIGSIGLKQLGGAAAQAFAQSKAKTSLINHLSAMLWNSGKTVGFQTASSLASEEVNVLADVVDGFITKNPSVFPKSLDEINARLFSSVEKGFQAAALTTAGIHVAAKTTGAAVSLVTPKKPIKPPKTTLEYLKMVRWMQENPYLSPEYMPDFKADESGVLKATVEKSEPSLEDTVVIAEAKRKQLKDELNELKAERESVQKSGGVEFPGDKTLEELNTEIESKTKAYAKAVASEKKAKLKVERFEAEERATDPNITDEAKSKAEADIQKINNKLHEIKKVEIKTNAQAKLESVEASLVGVEQGIYDTTTKQVDIMSENVRDLKIKLKAAKTNGEATVRLENQLQKAEVDLTNLKREIAGEPGQSLKLKLERKEKLLTEKEDLETLLAVIDDSKPQDLQGIKVDISGGKVNALVKLAGQAIKRALKNKGNSIKTNQKLLRGIIEKQLPKRLRGEFLKDLEGVQTEEQLGKALEVVQTKIDAIIEKEAHAEAKLKVEEQLDRPRIKTSGTRKVNQLTGEDSHEALGYIDDMVKHPEKAQQVKDQYLANRDEGLAPEKGEELQYEAAKLVGNLNEKTSTQVHELAALLEDIIDYETNTNLAAAAKRRADYENRVIQLAIRINGNKPVDMDPQGSKVNNVKFTKWKLSDNPLFRFLASINLRTGDAPAATFLQKLDIAMQDTPPEARKMLIDELDVMAKADDARAEKESLYIDLMLDYAKEETGLSEKDVLQLYGKASREKITIDWIDPNGNPKKWEGTRAQLIDIYTSLKDETLHNALIEGNGFTGKDIGNSVTEPLFWKNRTVKDDFQSMVENPVTGLSDVELKLAIARRRWYKETFHDMAEGYKKETKGLKLEQNPNYSGPAKHYRQADEAKADRETILPRFGGLVGDFSPVTTKNKSTIERKGSNKAIEGQNILTKDLEYAHNLARYTEMQHASEVLSVFADKRIKYILDAKYPGLHAEIMNHIKDAVNGSPKARNQWQKFINWFIAQHPKIALAAKPLMLPKQQFAGLATFSIGVPTRKFFEYVNDYYTNPEAGDSIIWSSKAVQSRYKNFSETASGVIPDAEGIKKESAIRKTLMLSITEGDKAALPGFYAHYMYNLKDLGKTPEQAMKAAERAFDLQGSRNISSQSNMARDPNWKWITMYQNQPTAMALEGVKTFRDLVNHPSKQTLESAASIAVKTRLAEVLFVSIDSAWKYATAEDDKQRDAAIRAPFKALVTGATPFVIGSLQQIGATILLNTITGSRERWYAPSFTFFDAIENTAYLAEDLTTPLKRREDELDRTFKILLHYNSSLFNFAFGQIPLGPPVKEAKKYYNHQKKSGMGSIMWLK